MTADETKIKGHLCAFLATVMWGMMAPIAKDAMEVFSPFMLTTFRLAGGALLFWVVSFFMRSDERVVRGDMFRLFLAGLFAFVFNQGLFLSGLSMTTPVDATIVTTMLPIITLVFAAVFLHEPLSGLKALGVAVGFAGAVTLILSSANGGKLGGDYRGDLLIFLAQMSFAVYLTMFKDLTKKYSSVTVNKWIFLFSSVCYLPVSGSQFLRFDWSVVTLDLALEVMYVVLFGSFFAYLLYVESQSYLRPTVLAMYNYVQPITASTLAVALGMAEFSVLKAVSVALVFLGVFLVTQSRSKEEAVRK